MVTTLYLIRHGETEGSGAKRYHGSLDIPLSGRGALQMRGVSQYIVTHLKASSVSKRTSYLRDIHEPGQSPSPSSHGGGISKDASLQNEDQEVRLHAVYCSDLVRAMRSAEIVAEPHGLKVIPLEELRERNFGVWEGMTFSEIKERYPEEFASWADDPLHHSPVGGENTIRVRDRVTGALDRILDHHRGGNVLIVAHGGVNRVILSHVMELPLGNIFRIEQDQGAVNIIEFWERYPVVKLVNGIVYGIPL
jgi:broad specificity phosphatase PhoE